MRISDWSSDVCSSDLPDCNLCRNVIGGIIERPAYTGGLYRADGARGGKAPFRHRCAIVPQQYRIVSDDRLTGTRIYDEVYQFTLQPGRWLTGQPIRIPHDAACIRSDSFRPQPLTQAAGPNDPLSVGHIVNGRIVTLQRDPVCVD